MSTPRLVIAAFALAASLGVAAQETKFVSASPSPLKQSGEIPPNETTFSGQVQISGRFVVIREQGTEGYPGYYRILLKPDASSQSLLPYDAARGPVQEIWLRDTESALRSLLSASQRKSLRNGGAHQMSGFVTVVIASYRTGVDCDQRGYNAILSKVIQPPSKIVASRALSDLAGGC